MIYDQYRHRASPEPLRILEDSTSYLVRHASRVLAEREKAERRSRPPQSWSEEQERTASAGVTERESLAERIRSYEERRNRPPQVEEVPPPGPALAAAIVRAGAKARGEIT
jgi:hypothetical protein